MNLGKQQRRIKCKNSSAIFQAGGEMREAASGGPWLPKHLFFYVSW